MIVAYLNWQADAVCSLLDIAVTHRLPAEVVTALASAAQMAARQECAEDVRVRHVMRAWSARVARQAWHQRQVVAAAGGVA